RNPSGVLQRPAVHRLNPARHPLQNGVHAGRQDDARAGRQVGREERGHLEIIEGRLLHDVEEWSAKLLCRAQHVRQQMVDHEGHDLGRDVDEVAEDGGWTTDDGCNAYLPCVICRPSFVVSPLIVGFLPESGLFSSQPYPSVSNRRERASIISSRPTSPSPKPTISRITSSAMSEPTTPVSAPRMPASAQAGTVPGGGGSGNKQR